MNPDKIIDDYLDTIQLSEINVGSEFGSVFLRLTNNEVAVAGIAAAAAIIWFATKAAIKLSQSKRCKSMKHGSTVARICENEVMIMKEKKRIEILKSKIHLCKNSKDRAKCEQKVKEKIIKAEAKIKEKEARIKDLKQKRSQE